MPGCGISPLRKRRRQGSLAAHRRPQDASEEKTVVRPVASKRPNASHRPSPVTPRLASNWCVTSSTSSSVPAVMKARCMALGTTRPNMPCKRSRSGINASLPLDQPDYVLLTLLQSQKAQSCKTIAQPSGGSYVATSRAATQTKALPGRMGAGASMVGQDLRPRLLQAQDGVASDYRHPSTGGVRAPPAAALAVVQFRHRGALTRQVFNKMMLNAP